MQWLPYWWRVQWLYPAYRCTLSFYFLVWLVYSIYDSWIYHKLEQHFSFFTNWSFLLWNVYLFVSAINVSLNQLWQCCSQRKSKNGGRRSSNKSRRRICCTCGEDRSTVCDKITWLLFTISSEVAVAVTVLYWVLSSWSDDAPSQSGLNFHVHLLNGIMAVLDLWIVGFPIHIFHFLYTFLYASCYVAFTGVHYATNSTASSDGKEYIYSVLDYGSKPGLAIGVVLGSTLGLLPLIHILFISQYLVRTWITSHLHKRLETYRKFLPAQETETGLNNVNDWQMSEAGTSRITSTTADDHCDV